MSNSDSLRDRIVMFTGNVVFDAAPDARVSAFAIGGVGMFWGREQLRNGPYWGNDPAFTAGGGVRANVIESVAVGGEYRIGWELHQRVSLVGCSDRIVSVSAGYGRPESYTRRRSRSQRS